MTEKLPLEFQFITRRNAALNSAFEIAIEVFGRIELGRIWRQKEHFNSIAMRIKPLAHVDRLMHAQIVKDQEHLALRVFDQSAHEHDEQPRQQRSLINHESHLALIGHRRYQRQTASTRRDSDNRRLTLRRKSTVPTL